MTVARRSAQLARGHGHGVAGADTGAPGRRTRTAQLGHHTPSAAAVDGDHEPAETSGGCEEGCTHEGHAHGGRAPQEASGGCDDGCTDETHGHGGRKARAGGDGGPIGPVDFGQLQAVISRLARQGERQDQPAGPDAPAGPSAQTERDTSDPGSGGGSAVSLGLASFVAMLGDEPNAAYAVTAQKPPGFPGKLGKAKWKVASSPTLSVETKKKGDEHVAKVKSTTVPALTSSAVAAPAGSHALGKQDFDVDGKTEKFAITLVITEAIHQEVVRGEQEHLDDYQRAYDLSFKKAGEVVNAEAGKEHTASSKDDAVDAARDAVIAKLPSHLKDPDTWMSVLESLAGMSETGRDEQGTHTWSYVNPTPDADVDIKGKKAKVSFESNTALGAASSTIVDPSKL
jgi:hypothetical protein